MRKTYLGLFLISSSLIYSQNTENQSDQEKTLEEVTIGSRNKKRTVVNTAVPIDVLDVKQISSATGQIEINQMLQFAAPSFNSNKQSGSDGSDHVDPATLRGLGPDQTLVLLNGKRYHQSSLVNLFGTKGRGNTGTDMNTIPLGAIKKIEVLRDGASAQYGSDAIAGVINIILNDRKKGFEGNLFYGINIFNSPKNYDLVNYGKTFDGNSFMFSGNYGTKIGKNDGFLNLTLELTNKDYSFRVPNPEKYPTPREKYGDGKAQNIYTFYNSEIPLNPNIKFYSNGGFSYRDSDSYAWTRKADSDQNIPEIYPNGFNPLVNAKIYDYTTNNGLKFKLLNFNIDLYNAFGYNKFGYDVLNSLNTSLGLASPTNFDAGGHSLMQNTSGFNATKNYNFLKGFNLAFGSEFRTENFRIYKGEESSYIQGDKDKPSSSQGFPGYSNLNEIAKVRNNIAGYIDSELDITDKFMISLAGRFENYNDFGSSLTGKFSTRYSLTKDFAVRGSASTGFRAPSLAQKYYSANFTNVVDSEVVRVSLPNNDSKFAQEIGIPALKEEKSRNASLGFTYNKPRFTATVDGYYVKVIDRIVLTGEFDPESSPEIAESLNQLNVDQAKFFTNAIDTETFGIDVILSYNHKIGQGKINLTLAQNFNDMKITKVYTSEKLQNYKDIYFSKREEAFVISSAPKNKTNLSINYKINKFNVNVQMVRFDRIKLIDYDGNDQIYNPKITTDLSFGYDLTKKVNFILGIKNAFNRYPTKMNDVGNTETGGLFDPVQMGFLGLNIFTKLTFSF